MDITIITRLREENEDESADWRHRTSSLMHTATPEKVSHTLLHLSFLCSLFLPFCLSLPSWLFYRFFVHSFFLFRLCCQPSPPSFHHAGLHRSSFLSLFSSRIFSEVCLFSSSSPLLLLDQQSAVYVHLSTPHTSIQVYVHRGDILKTQTDSCLTFNRLYECT